MTIGRFWAAFGLTLGLLVSVYSAQNSTSTKLTRDHFRSGEEILRAFAPVSEKVRHSIVRFNVDGEIVCLGAIIDTNGLALTKASELKKGKLTCWLANETEVAAERISTDEEDDVALVRVRAAGLKPIEWVTDEVKIGQWAITPGIAATPHAVGIISALPHRIRPQRAVLGIEFDLHSSAPKVERVFSGLGAQKAGMVKGDLIVAVNNSAVSNRQQVVEIILEFRKGQTVKLRVQRAEEQFDLEIQLMSPVPGMFGTDSSDPDAIRLEGRVSQRSEGFEQAIEHDTVLQPWLCGGPLVNLEGKAIGLNIARAGRVTTYALPAKLVKRIIKNLQSKTASTKLWDAGI